MSQANLIAAVEKIDQRLLDMYDQPRPDGAVDGSANQWTAMRKSLLEERQLLLEQIQSCDAPFEVTVYPEQG